MELVPGGRSYPSHEGAGPEDPRRVEAGLEALHHHLRAAGGAGHGSPTRSAPSSTVQRARRERLARTVATRSARSSPGAKASQDSPSAARETDGGAAGLGRADHVRQVGRAAGDLQDRAVGASAGSARCALPQLVVVLGRRRRPRASQQRVGARAASARGGAAEADQQPAGAVRPGDVEAVGLQRAAGRARAAAAAAGPGRRLAPRAVAVPVGQRVQPHRDRARSARACRTSR